MVRRRVCVEEGDAVKVDVVVAVGEAAEVGFALAQPDAVGAGGEGAGNDLDDLAEIGDWRSVVLDVGVGYQRLRGALFDEAAAGSRLRGDGINAGVDGYILRDGADAQRKRDKLSLPVAQHNFALG